eukprot:scaffold108_cov162-Amphora_coffeaeformis.AAC.32
MKVKVKSSVPKFTHEKWGGSPRLNFFVLVVIAMQSPCLDAILRDDNRYSVTNINFYAGGAWKRHTKCCCSNRNHPPLILKTTDIESDCFTGCDLFSFTAPYDCLVPTNVNVDVVSK